MVADGRLDRDEVITAALNALSGTESATSQKPLAFVLRGCRFGATTSPGHESLVSQLIPLVHANARPVLLDAVLSADLTDGTLLDIGTMILARSEKAPKKSRVSPPRRRPGSFT
ncbi:MULTISPECIES: hypothetical protein [unclassified Gordonia (in: high G+C Gram-positive bacteria)]